MNQFKLRKKIDVTIPTIGLILSVFGLVMILSASQISAGEKFGDPYYFFTRQLVSWFVGLAAFFYFLRVPVEKLYERRVTFLLITLVSLLLVFVPIIGPKIANVHRWINLGVSQVQPAEFAKLFLIIYFSGWLAAKGDAVRDPIRTLLPFAALLGFIVLLVIGEPDMGTALVLIVIALVSLFVARPQLWQYIALLGVGIVLLVGLIYIAPYRAARLKTFLGKNDNSQDTLGAAYHSQQALIAVGSGGWWGVGFGQGTSKYSYLPQSHTDSIFAVIGEELGFVRSAVVILLYFFLLWRSLVITVRANSRFVQLMAISLGTTLVAQMLINVGGMLSVLPLTGVPLPFISYGGSSLIVSMAIVGLLANISREVV